VEDVALEIELQRAISVVGAFASIASSRLGFRATGCSPLGGEARVVPRYGDAKSKRLRRRIV
jgi:hypothetical protein